MLQLHGGKLGWDIMCTPKCHAELAGEGVEYMWAKAKGAYRNKRLQEKKGKAKFIDSVKQCLSEEVLPIDQIRKCARRARRYVVVYNALDANKLVEKTSKEYKELGHVVLDRLTREMKSQRSKSERSVGQGHFLLF